MTIIDRIFQEVAGISIPHFFITVEFSAMGCEMPERIEAFLWEKYEIILRGANGRKFVYHKGEWRFYSAMYNNLICPYILNNIIINDPINYIF